MTRQKSFKRRVRARMDKTAERYTTARRQLLAKAAESEGGAGSAAAPGAEAEGGAGSVATPAAPRAEAERGSAAGPGAPEPTAASAAPAGGVKRPYSDEVVGRNTGRTWDEWFAMLDAWGAVERPHPEIARWLMDEHGLGGWWAQGVTVAYEQARGLRAPGQRRDGSWEVNVTKTVNVPVARLYEAFADPDLRERWLPGAGFEVRTAQPGRSMRANWEDGSTRLVIGFTALGEAKSQVAVAHQRIPDSGTADKLRAYWRERVAALKRVLEAGSPPGRPAGR